MHTLKSGMLAYYDTFSGCIPCKVLSITGTSGVAASYQEVTLKLTAPRGAYERGEIHTVWGLKCVPRPCVHGNRIRPYMVECDS